MSKILTRNVENQITTRVSRLMTDDERIARLGVELAGAGALVNGPFQIWALDSQLSDGHLRRISSWANLKFLMAAGCSITDAGLNAICCFRRLESLDIGGTEISANAIVAADLPVTLTCLGLYGLPLNDEVAKQVCQLPALQMLNCNGCRLSLQAFQQLAEMPRLLGFEALSCPVPDDVAQTISRRKPDSLLRLDSGVWRNGRRPNNEP
jgi:hypothetical protein